MTYMFPVGEDISEDDVLNFCRHHLFGAYARSHQPITPKEV